MAGDRAGAQPQQRAARMSQRVTRMRAYPGDAGAPLFRLPGPQIRILDRRRRDRRGDLAGTLPGRGAG